MSPGCYLLVEVKPLVCIICSVLLAVLDPRVGNTMDVLSPVISVLCHSDWLPRGVLSTSWCCPPRPCVAFLAYVHLALFLALSLFPGNSLVSSWCNHASFLVLTVSNRVHPGHWTRRWRDEEQTVDWYQPAGRRMTTLLRSRTAVITRCDSLLCPRHGGAEQWMNE